MYKQNKKIKKAKKSVETLVKLIRKCGNINKMITRANMSKTITAAEIYLLKSAVVLVGISHHH